MYEKYEIFPSETHHRFQFNRVSVELQNITELSIQYLTKEPHLPTHIDDCTTYKPLYIQKSIH